MNILSNETQRSAQVRVETVDNSAKSDKSDATVVAHSAAINIEEVAISSQFQLLEDGAQQLAQLPEVDIDRVAALSAALADGSFNIDLNEIATAMTDQHGKR
ncbi:flagellar biosynthesis anti-sigma factor FlgM [Ferrimonas lipolytica]|uniref:Negative regulator of flagellin synthesis n=1 Tax=Ferrimonas lipolytica TaxID=2724191 RepID=A0A6H1UG79_9GAMM|nr:flagellar biosynthesis anti-sigma factor FlgM [Ferrimonas lipolytica]QIZ76802.1 flagellar biosynthesis anti-sigma factor FlgM [Ferrimonas lipolytica]